MRVPLARAAEALQCAHRQYIMITCLLSPPVPPAAAGTSCKVAINCTDAPGPHIQLAEVELYGASGARMPQSSLSFAMSSVYSWNNDTAQPRPAELCNDGDYATLCHSENPAGGDPWPWLSATYPCADGSTSLNKVVVVNR